METNLTNPSNSGKVELKSWNAEISEISEALGCADITVFRLQASGLAKIRAGVRGMQPSDVIGVLRDELQSTQEQEDALILATAEELGLPEPTTRFEGLEATLRDLFRQAGRVE